MISVQTHTGWIVGAVAAMAVLGVGALSPAVESHEELLVAKEGPPARWCTGFQRRPEVCRTRLAQWQSPRENHPRLIRRTHPSLLRNCANLSDISIKPAFLTGAHNSILPSEWAPDSVR